MTTLDIEKQKKRLITMYLRDLLSKEWLIIYLNKLNEPIIK